MTAYSMNQLNRRIDILYRYLSGDSSDEIAKSENCSPQNIRKILVLANRNKKVMDAVKQRMKINEEWSD